MSGWSVAPAVGQDQHSLPGGAEGNLGQEHPDDKTSDCRPDSKDLSWFQCGVCKASFPCEADLAKHKRQWHPAAADPPMEQRLECCFCDKSMKGMNEAIRHVNREHLDAVLDNWCCCHFCDLFFPDQRTMKRHMAQQHSSLLAKAKSVQCQFCCKFFCSAQDLYNHAMATHFQLICNVWSACGDCHMMFPDMRDVDQHKADFHLAKTKGKLKCPFCAKVLSHSSAFHKHANVAHTMTVFKIWSQCPDCELCYPNQSSLKQHHIQAHRKQDDVRQLSDQADTHEQSSSLCCQFCGERCQTSEQQHMHANQLHFTLIQNKWSSCSVCRMLLPTMEAVEEHTVRSHGSGAAANPRNSDDSSSSSQVVEKCAFCKATFTTPQSYHQHANKVHSNLIRLSWKMCGKCRLYYPSEHSLSCHIQSAHSARLASAKGSVAGADKRVSCSFCPATLSARNVFYMHANTAHLSDIAANWVSCDACKMYVPNAAALDRHRAQAHRDKQKRVARKCCRFCSKDFINVNALYKHVNQSHLCEATIHWHMCPVCQKYFPDPEVVERHVYQTHPEVKQHQPELKCEFCAEIQPDEIQYLMHANVVHNDHLAASGWVGCTRCSWFLPSAEAVEKHELREHPQPDREQREKRFPCQFCMKTFCLKAVYYKHANLLHGGLVSQKWVQCARCDFYLPDMTSLLRHQSRAHRDTRRTHRGGERCRFCYQLFSSSSAYYQHANQQHLMLLCDKNWALCKKCDFFLPNKLALKQHMASAHRSKKSKSQRQPQYKDHHEAQGDASEMLEIELQDSQSFAYVVSCDDINKPEVVALLQVKASPPSSGASCYAADGSR